MTNRDFYLAIVNANINDEITAHAQTALEKLDATNEKRRMKNLEKANENQAYIDAIVGALGTEPKTATMLLEELFAGKTHGEDEKPFTVQFVSSLCRAAVAQEKAVAVDVKIPKKGLQKAYTIVG